MSVDTETPEFPGTLAENEQWVIVGIECATKEGTTAMIRSTDASGGYKAFNCVCTGSITAGTQQRYCDMHVWMCPRIS